MDKPLSMKEGIDYVKDKLENAGLDAIISVKRLPMSTSKIYVAVGIIPKNTIVTRVIRLNNIFENTTDLIEELLEY